MLTKSQIEQAKPPATGRTVLWDHTLPGFGARVFPSGQRSFILQYRLPGSRKKQTATIGTYGQLTLPQARTKALELLAKLRLGSDPQAERKARAKAESVGAELLTVRKLVGRYTAALRAGTAKTKRLKGRAATPAYIADIELHLGRFADVCGKQAAAAIMRSDVVAVLNDYADQPSAHRRMHGAIHRMFSWARRAELLANDPASDIETTTAAARERVLSLKELTNIWHAAEQLDPLYRDLVHLMILTGQRRTEVAGMTWGEIPHGLSLWILPSQRTKARRQHSLPLPPLAQEILQARLATFQHKPSSQDLVLPTLSRDGKTIAPVSGWNWLKRELDRRVDIPPWHLHDFRRSLVTICAEHGADVAVLDTLLNHASSATRGGVIGTYQRATLIEPMRKLMASWDGLLQEALAKGEVVAFSRRKAK
jgi:integrase